MDGVGAAANRERLRCRACLSLGRRAGGIDVEMTKA